MAVFEENFHKRVPKAVQAECRALLKRALDTKLQDFMREDQAVYSFPSANDRWRLALRRVQETPDHLVSEVVVSAVAWNTRGGTWGTVKGSVPYTGEDMRAHAQERLDVALSDRAQLDQKIAGFRQQLSQHDVTGTPTMWDHIQQQIV